jgi:hypothetical protein
MYHLNDRRAERREEGGCRSSVGRLALRWTPALDLLIPHAMGAQAEVEQPGVDPVRLGLRKRQ